MKKLVIFDLDGTLLNTIADLAAATNFALKQCHFPTHNIDEYNFFVGKGINHLFACALPESARNDENIAKMRQHFLKFYNAHNCDETRPYCNMINLLERLQNQGIKIAVASNKYQAGTEKLVAKYFPTIHFAAVLGQRENVPVKPDPTIVFDILKIADCQPENALYVGDSDVDMQTANNAQVEAVGVTWGFRSRQELEQYNPAHIVNEANAIFEIATH